MGHGRSHRVFDLSGGGPPHTDAVGVHGVWVNGQQVADGDGVRADAPLAGHLIAEFER